MPQRMKLAEIRRARGFSQEYMGKLLGMTRITYAKLEENPENVTMLQASKIAEILSVKVDDIIFLDSILQNVE